MCFNADVSISTYLIGMVGCFFLYQKKHYIEALTFACVLQMQLIEFFLWNSQNCHDPMQRDINIVSSQLGVIINHLEPIVLYLSILYFVKKPLPLWLHVVVFVYLISAIWYVLGALTQQSCVVVTEFSSPHLYWHWNTSGQYYPFFYILFLCTICFLFFYGLQAPYHQFVSFLVLFFFLLSYVMYRKKLVVGSMWCFFSSFLPWILLFRICLEKKIK